MGTETTPYKPVDGEKTQAVCMRASDGSKVSAIAHYDEHGLDQGVVFTDALNIEINAANFEEITVGACPVDTQCVESQEWTYGIDNTGTNTNVDAILCITNSDGSTIEITQTPQGRNQWTPQMQEWGTNIQSAANAAGLLWFADTRFRLPSDPSNLAGGGGFSGPPSLAVSLQLTNMLWRYVNIQICPGQPVPVSAVWKELDAPDGNIVKEVIMTTDGAVLGPLKKFWLCTECGREPVWYLDDAVTLAEAGQIPNCWEPCGTITLADSPPDRSCNFFFAEACDNVGEPDADTNWVNLVTRRATVCSGEQIAVDYFVPDPDDATALIDYALVGAFVDCDTGEPVELPPQPCVDFVSLGKMWYLNVPDTAATLVEWWADPNGTQAGTAVDHDSVSSIFTNTGTTMEHVSGAANNSYIADVFSFEGSNASDFLTGMGGLGTDDTSGEDQFKLSAYFYLTQDAKLRDGGTRTGERGGLWIDECCTGSLELVEERTIDTTSGDRGVFDGTIIPAGIHYGEALLSDLSQWANLTLEASFDDGVSYGPLLGYLEKPTMTQIPVIKCKDTGLVLNAITEEVLDLDLLFCENVCAAPAESSSSESVQWVQAIGYICDQNDERFGDLVCWDVGYSGAGIKTYPDSAESPVYLDLKTEEALEPQPVLVGKASPLSAPESTYKCYTSTATELQTTASDESGTFVWDDAAQGTDLDNAFAFTVSDVGGLAGLNMDFSIDESDGLGSLFTTGSSNGSTNSDNGGAYQFRAGFEGQTDQESRLRHVMDFSEPVIIDSFFVGDIDRGGDQTQTDITRWQDAARVYGIDSQGNEVAFEQIPGADLVVHANGFSYMPQDAVEQAGDEDAGNWLTVNSQGVAVMSMIIEYFPGTDAGWNSDETADANYSIPNSSSRMQLHNLEVTRATEESVEVESTRSACATLDTDGSEIWRDATTVVKLTEEELATLVDCGSETIDLLTQILACLKDDSMTIQTLRIAP